MLRSLLAISFLLALSVPRTAAALTCVVPLGEREHIIQSFADSTAVFSAYVEEIYFGKLYGRDDVRMANFVYYKSGKAIFVQGIWWLQGLMRQLSS